MTLPERVADQIRRRILLDELKAGARLESCRAMARDAQVGIGVVREAVAALRAERLVQVRQGVGVFVMARPRKASVMRAARRTAGRRETFELRESGADRRRGSHPSGNEVRADGTSPARG
jgi:DNA-binding FadR family transcriptional regulator